MFSRKDTRVVLAIAVAALLVMAFAYQASATFAAGSAPFTYSGQIVSLDSGDRYLTVQAGPNDELNFTLDDGAPVMVCSMDERLANLKVGDHVTVSYFEKGTGGYIATQIISLPSGMNQC